MHILVFGFCDWRTKRNGYKTETRKTVCRVQIIFCSAICKFLQLTTNTLYNTVYMKRTEHCENQHSVLPYDGLPESLRRFSVACRTRTIILVVCVSNYDRTHRWQGWHVLITTNKRRCTWSDTWCTRSQLWYESKDKVLSGARGTSPNIRESQCGRAKYGASWVG